jgi:hypothetical protein
LAGENIGRSVLLFRCQESGVRGQENTLGTKSCWLVADP